MLESVEQYYTEKLKTHGPTARGVDWNSPESQALRFEQVLKVCDADSAFSINDYGCGYGALSDFLVQRGYSVQYRGFDVSDQMIAEAKKLHRRLSNCDFFREESNLTVADYTVASGVFNVKLRATDDEWERYFLRTLERIAELSSRGFAFNALTKYSDRDRMRPDLYYADPLFLFDYCKRKFTRFVSLLHDYPLYEFTIIVRKV
ncbi:MAG: SAM-dependent methyltransferase [Acidobacteria bacterium]|nr:MAG: SAM-dependent methyltransferase [Acidobacteriota bacterium]